MKANTWGPVTRHPKTPGMMASSRSVVEPCCCKPLEAREILCRSWRPPEGCAEAKVELGQI